MKQTHCRFTDVGQSPFFAIALLLSIWSLPFLSWAADQGIASRYVGDQGIQKDPDVVFAENFEDADLQVLLSKWEYATHEERMAISSDTPAVSAGRQSLLMSGSADLFQRLLPGHDLLHIRFYARFDGGCESPGHWVWLGGRYPSVAWPWPEAGTCPAGDERWATGVEPMGTRWAWDFYTYWMGMHSAPGGKCWANTFSGRPSTWPVVKNEWICVEFMVKMNDPVTAWNGEQAFWINGEKKAHLGPGFPVGKWIWDGFYPDDTGQPFEGFQWRKAQELNINYVWLEHYVPNDPGCGCWFDDLVIAKAYIGPIFNEPRPIYVDPNGVCNGLKPCFSTIQDEIDAAMSGADVNVLQGSYVEHLVIQKVKNVNIQGGWDPSFSAQTAKTTVQSITIGGRSSVISVNHLTIK